MGKTEISIPPPPVRFRAGKNALLSSFSSPPGSSLCRRRFFLVDGGRGKDSLLLLLLPFLHNKVTAVSRHRLILLSSPPPLTDVRSRPPHSKEKLLDGGKKDWRGGWTSIKLFRQIKVSFSLSRPDGRPSPIVGRTHQSRMDEEPGFIWEARKRKRRRKEYRDDTERIKIMLTFNDFHP